MLKNSTAGASTAVKKIHKAKLFWRNLLFVGWVKFWTKIWHTGWSQFTVFVWFVFIFELIWRIPLKGIANASK